MRRKPGHLVPLEIAICEAAADLSERGQDAFHGYELAKKLRRIGDARLLTAFTAHCTARLADSRKWGSSRADGKTRQIPARENRPGRRLYTLTAAADAVLAEVSRNATGRSRKRPRRWVPA